MPPIDSAAIACRTRRQANRRLTPLILSILRRLSASTLLAIGLVNNLDNRTIADFTAIFDSEYSRILMEGASGRPIDQNHRCVVSTFIFLLFERGANSKSGGQWTDEPRQRGILPRLDAGHTF